jgi:3-oxoacyl-[acyl-carrier-protein] synthase III
MTPLGLLGVASELPAHVVPNDFFTGAVASRRGMFTAPAERRHVGPDESAAALLERAGKRLVAKLGLEPARDIDILFTNVAVRLSPGAAPRWRTASAAGRAGSSICTTRAASPSSTCSSSRG